MTGKEKVKIFEEEFKYINDENIRKDAEYLISHLPDYYFEVDASVLVNIILNMQLVLVAYQDMLKVLLRWLMNY